MKRILGIFRKDLRHLWPQTLLFWAMLAVAAAMDPVLDKLHSSWPMMHQLPLVLEPLACWLLVVSVIHGETLIGDEQYWLTRPYSWKHLMAAKGLFLVVLVNLPVLVCQIATLAAVGIPPLPWLTALLWRQVFFTIFFLLTAAAVAAVTRNLGQVLLACVLLYAAFVAAFGLSQTIQGRWSDWGNLDWIRVCGTALVVASGTALALAMQYSRRATALSRAALAATVVLATLVMTAPRWGGAFAIQRLSSRERIGDAAVRVSIDQSRAGTQPAHWETRSSDPSGVRLEIPMRVDDVPQGATVGIDQTSVSLKSARGTWRSGWLTFQTLHDLSQGTAWLTVFVDPDFYNASADAVVELGGTVDLTLDRRVRAMVADDTQKLVPEFGLCEPAVGSTMANCFTPFQQVSVELVAGNPVFREETSLTGPYAPFPTSASVRALDAVLLGKFSPASATYSTLWLVMCRPVAHIERNFQVRGLRMSRFRLPWQSPAGLEP
jgi:hypothetical protein